MPAHHTLHVALDEKLVSYVREQVTVGRYANASQVVRAALECHLENSEIREAAASGLETIHA